jgi:hypothetical protein
MSALGTRKHRGRRGWARLLGRLQVHIDPLVTHELQTGSTMLSATPVFPEEGSEADLEWMEQHADPM